MDSSSPPTRTHPHFDDGGATRWHRTLADGLEEARRSGRRVFIEIGREL